MRAIAALSVLMTHTGFLSGAQVRHWWGHYSERLEVGVCIFFLISGFLLYRPFVSARINGARRTRLRAYARRRLLRIVPAYWVALTVLAVWPGLEGVFTKDWWVYYFFLQIYSNDHVLNGIGPAWSLCVEMSFYALLPLYAWGVARAVGGLARQVQVRTELILLTLMGLTSLALRDYLRDTDISSTLLNTIVCHMDWFAVGMGMAVVSAALQGAQRSSIDAFMARFGDLSWVAAFAVFTVVALIVPGIHYVELPDGRPFAYYVNYQDVLRHALYGLTAALLLLPAVFGTTGGGLARRLLATRWLGWLGLISYGIYLWQMPILVKASAKGVGDWIPGSRYLSLSLIAGGAVIVCAATSYYVVERPLLRFKDGWPRGRAGRRPQPAERVPAG